MQVSTKSFLYRYSLLPNVIFLYSFIHFCKFCLQFHLQKINSFFFHLNMNYKRINIPLETWDHQLPAQDGERV